MHNRNTEQCIRVDAANAHCLGIIHLGDLVDANNTQNLIAFRQIWERSYPGHDGGSLAGVPDDNYSCYSQGYRINKPVFPIVGNHDIPTYKNDDRNWNQVESYIQARVKNANGIVSYYGRGAYAWRWGQYFFVTLGTWAGSGKTEGSYDSGKLVWLDVLLEQYVGDSNMGVLIFQHYGWDSISLDGRWWSQDDRDEELNILCRRENTSDPANPYNVLGIFTGHVHKQGHHSISVGHNADGDAVHFDNYQMMSAGSLTDNQYGFSIVILSATELKMNTKNVHKSQWTVYTKPISVGR